MSDNFERKLNKHKKKPPIIFYEDELSQYANFQKVPIEEEPPHKKAYTTSIRSGDVVTYDNASTNMTGVVVEVYWARASTSQSFDKKSGSYIREYNCFPEALVMWSEGNVETVDPKWLLKIT